MRGVGLIFLFAVIQTSSLLSLSAVEWLLSGVGCSDVGYFEVFRSGTLTAFSSSWSLLEEGQI